MSQSRYTIQSVNRALRILKLFDERNKELSIVEISAMMDLNKSTVIRFLATLEDEGYLERDPVSKKYKLGIVLFRLGNLVEKSLDINRVAEPVMQALSDETELIVHFGTSQKEKAILLQKKWPQNHVSDMEMIARVGGYIPIYCTGIGKLMLAYQAPDKVDQIMDLIEFHPYTPNTMDSKEALMAELETIRSQGYAENNEEHELYMYSLTYPVRDHRGQVVAGISLSGIKEKILNMSQGMLHQSLKRAALQISRKLGYQGS
jgi:DNA-binding IclR family transcriptional regulator